MYYLVKGIVATGADVFHPGQSPAAVSTDDDHSNSSDTGANLNLNLEPESGPSSESALIHDVVANEIMEDEEPSGVRCPYFIDSFFFLNLI